MNENVKRYLVQVLQVYLTLVIVLMIVDVTILLMLTFFPLKPGTIVNVYNFDLVVCLLLIFSLIMTLITKEHKIQFLKKRWVFIPAIIPFDFIFLGLLGFPLSIPLSILRLIHIAAIIKTLTKIGSSFVIFSRKTGLSYGIVILTIIFLFSSTAFFLVEQSVNPEVKSYEDATWYTATTMTTTGYGDIVPITSWGRILGVIMMIAGLGFTGYATASVASSLIDKFKTEREKDREIIMELSEEMAKKRSKSEEMIQNNLKEILDKLDEKK